MTRRVCSSRRFLQFSGEILKLQSNHLIWLGKLFVGVGLIGWLVLGVDTTALLEQLRSVHLGWFLAILAMPYYGILNSCVKWQMLLAARGIRAPLFGLIKLYIIGSFFNSFFPSTIGGDVVRAYQMKRFHIEGAEGVASIVMERLTGFAALISMMPLALLHPELVRAFPNLGLAIALIVAAFIAGCTLMDSERLSRALEATSFRNRLLGRATGLLRRTHTMLLAYRGHSRRLIAAYVWSVFFYLGATMSVWFAAQAVNADLSLIAALCITPLVMFAGLLPISLNGLGVMEVGYVLVLGIVGVPQDSAFTIALLLRARMVLLALVGGLVFLVDRGTANAATLDGQDS